MRWFGRFLLPLLWLVSGPLFAHGAIRWVRASATGSGDGSDSLTQAWTMTQANQGAQPGDVVNVINGIYSVAPVPMTGGGTDRHGTCANGGGAACFSCNRITYVGNLDNPELVVFPGFKFRTNRCVTVKGFSTINGGISIGSNTEFMATVPMWDSLATFRSGSITLISSKYCSISDFTMGAPGVNSIKLVFDCTNNVRADSAFKGVTNDTLLRGVGFLHSNNSNNPFKMFNNHGSNIYNCATPPCDCNSLDPDKKCVDVANSSDSWPESLYIAKTQLTIRDDGTPLTNSPMVEWYGCKTCRIEDNHWVLHQASQGYNRNWMFRDSVTRTVFLRDTVENDGPLTAAYYLDSPGTFPGSCINNKFAYCVFRERGTPVAPTVALIQFAGFQNDTIDHCVIKTSSMPGAEIDVKSGTNFFTHNTVSSPAAQGALKLTKGSSWTGTIRVVDNIFHSVGTSTTRPPYWMTETTIEKSGWVSTGNLVSHYYDVNGNRNFGYDPAPSLYNLSGWIAATTRDSASYYGSPQFLDSTGVLSFGGELGPDSRATGRASDGTDIGAKTYSADITPPQTINDLRVLALTSSTITLGWTSPGDDYQNPVASGTPTSYDLRSRPSLYSFGQWLAPNNGGPTSIWYTSGTKATHPPQVAGTLDSLTIANLNYSQVYSFMMIASDEKGNVSDFSNVAWILTNAPDETGGGDQGGGGKRPKEGD